jgi:hypothetical protein
MRCLKNNLTNRPIMNFQCKTDNRVLKKSTVMKFKEAKTEWKIWQNLLREAMAQKGLFFQWWWSWWRYDEDDGDTVNCGRRKMKMHTDLQMIEMCSSTTCILTTPLELILRQRFHVGSEEICKWMFLKIFLTVSYNRSDPKSPFALHVEQDKAYPSFHSGISIKVI